jgi:hypothetical protein
VEVLRRVWVRQFVREDGAPPGGGVRLRAKDEPPPPATEPIESPYDTQARFRTRSGVSWTGYVVHLTETCDDDSVHLITHTRPLCTRAEHRARHLKLPPRAEHEALRAARGRLATKEGRRRYARRAGVEGTLSQGVRAFGLRRSRYRGLAKTHLRHVATAAAIDLDRLAAWFRAAPRATTRTSRFAALAA